MKKIIDHIRRWNIWRKHSLNSNLHKFLVLIGFIKSPTMGTALLPEEIIKVLEAYDKAREEGMRILNEHSSTF